MMIEETAAQRSFRLQVREYLNSFMTPEVKSELIHMGESAELFLRLIRKMGADGWLGVAIPEEYGGRGLSALEQYIFFNEIRRAGAPFNLVTVNTVAPAIVAHGTEEQKRRYLPGILDGSIQVSIGYTEPEAGTDLAALSTRAVRVGDEYVINGQKVFTSLAHLADYIWLACRTDVEAPKHRGISIIMVPTSTPGYSYSPTPTLGFTTTTSYYDDVRVPVANLVGAENEGWRIIMSQLNHERVAIAGQIGLAERLWEDVYEWTKSPTPSTGQRPIDQPWVQQELARSRALLEAVAQMNWQMAARIAGDALRPADASIAKVLGSEGMRDVYSALLAIVGPAACLPSGSPEAFLAGELEFAARESQMYTFGGGTNDVQREIIAWGGLGIPRIKAGAH
jgi:alkylation response protein AidB-like acyl-CoA dehydrogenase